MKTLLIILGVIVLLVVAFQVATTVYTTRTEHQQYRLISRDGDLEIRLYPEAVMATAVSTTATYRGSANANFGKLAGYIFGGNKKSEKISMTSPVHMDLGTNGTSMSFVMPSRYKQDQLPLPNDAGITLHESPSEYVAAIRFGGFVSDADVQSQRETLARLLASKAISQRGNFRFLGYNPPFQWFGRRNEMIVGVEWQERGTVP